MFWNSHQRRFFPNRLRFKLYFACASLLIGSILLSFLLVYVLQRSYTYRLVDEKIAAFSSEFAYEYMTGEEEIMHSGSLPVHVQSLPQFARQFLEQEQPGFNLLYASYSQAGEAAVHVLINDAHGRLLVIDIAPASCNIREINQSMEARIAYMTKEFNEESYGEKDNHVFFMIMSPERELLAVSHFAKEHLEQLADLEIPEGQPDWTTTFTTEEYGKFVLQGKRLFDGNVLIIAGSLLGGAKNLAHLAWGFAAIMAVMLVLGMVGSWWIAGKFIGGIQRVNDTASHIANGDYAQRVAIGQEGLEIERLANTFNHMLDNTEHLLAELRFVSDDVAHDLRTPLTVLRGQAELAEVSGNLEALPSAVLTVCDRLQGTINTMLDITRVETGQEYTILEKLDVVTLAQQTVDIFQPTADERGITFKLTVPEPNRHVWIQANRTGLQRILGNLVDNALKFTPAGGSVTVDVFNSAHKSHLSVVDTGCGIAAADMNKIFKRFYRCDASRSQPGNGLGLCLVKANVNASGGSIVVESVPGQGSAFHVSWPKPENADADVGSTRPVEPPATRPETC